MADHEPIKVTREQWDAAFERYCVQTRCSNEGEWHDARAEFARILGPRPGPDTPPNLIVDGACAMRVVRGLFDHGTDWAIEPFGMTEWDYITPEDGERIRAWLAEVHEWASEQVGEVRDVG